MSDYFYFLSYAREDRDTDNHDCIRKFRVDLEQEVRRMKGSAEGRVGFFDGQDIKSGNNWPDALSKALCTSRVFVPIYSPTYFTKDYCGREWKIFHDRLEAYRRQNPDAQVENLIQPVLLEPPDRLRRRIPDSISHIQYTYDRYPKDYETEGLHVIFRVGVYKDSYEMFKNRLARRIVEVAEEYPLSPFVPHPDVRQTVSAFHQPGTQSSGTNGTPKTDGPRYVQFIFVAGRRDELEEIRNTTDYYGHRERDWRPFLPEVRDQVWWLAQDIATKERFEYETVSLGADIIQKLEEAELARKIVVVMVDTWTLRLERYRTFMRQYDNRDFLNCVVLVPWNMQDNETRSNQAVLKHVIQAAFPNKAIARDPSRFLDSINSLDELKKQLSQALPRARARIEQKMEVAKSVEIEGPMPRVVNVASGV